MQSQPPTSTTSLQKNPWPDPWSAPEEIAHDNEGGNLHNVANEGKDWDFLQASSGRSHEHSLFSSPHHQHHQQQQQRYLNRRSSLPLQQSPFTESHHLFAQPQQLIQQPSIESQPPPKIAPFAPSHIHSHHPQPSPGLYHMTAPPGQQQQYQQQQQQQLDQHFPMHQQQQVQQQQHRRDFHSVKRAPPVDMIEIDSKVQIIVELPGLKRENLKIDIHDKSHFLTLKGRYERDEYGEDVNFLMNERTHGKFRRRIRLPQHADIDHVQANMKDGLLTIEMPSLRKNDNFMKKKRVINVEGLYHQQQQQQQLEEPSTYSKARRFEWTDQDRSQVQTSADTTVHHHVK